jgi:hypothetical protein
VSQRRDIAPRPIDEDAPWVTLQEAHAATGIPVNTLRKWARREAVPSYLESDGELTLRMVDLAAVRERAEALGRPMSTAPVEPRPEPAPATTAEPADAPASTDTMIVPVDAWNKMLIQLGNLHEAGQQLAEARERAAKAETEVAFLRERLAEVRADRTPTPAEDSMEADDLPTMRELEQPVAAPAPEGGTRFWRYVYHGWRTRRR